MKRETIDRFVHKEVTLTFIDGEIAKGTLEYDEYHSNHYILKRPTEDCDISFPLSCVRKLESKEQMKGESKNVRKFSGI